MSSRYLIPDLLPGKTHTAEVLVKRSRFISSLAHGPSMELARKFIQEQRQLYADATHNCWAFCAGPPADTARIACSDDGEPHGTAGRPMLAVLLHCGVGELVCVVTRYFGGIKLGTAGLVRAYQEAVQVGLENLPTTEKIELVNINLQLQYKYIDTVRRLLNDYEAKVLSEDFSECVRLSLSLPREKREILEQRLKDLSNGAIQLSLP